jgi:hypothetical protein
MEATAEYPDYANRECSLGAKMGLCRRLVFGHTAGGLSVESPIFDYADFERLEHEGRQEFIGQMAQLLSRKKGRLAKR